MKENKVSRVLKDQAIWLVFIVLVIAFTIANPRFITMSNLLIMLRQVAVWGIASVGMMFVILLGDIDLGTGSVITFVNILCAKLMVEFGVNMYLAVLISLLASTLIGLLNGFMVATIGIPALIATFATQTAFSGIALIMCNGQPINGFPEKFSVFGAGWVGPVPIPVIIMIICFIIGAFILNKTYFGRYFYAVGGNIEAARLSGIRTGRVKYLVFALSGFFAGLAFKDSKKEIISIGEDVAAFGLDWTFVRFIMPTDKEYTGSVKVTYGKDKISFSISRSDIAEFMIEQVESDRYLREMPIIGG